MCISITHSIPMLYYIFYILGLVERIFLAFNNTALNIEHLSLSSTTYVWIHFVICNKWLVEFHFVGYIICHNQINYLYFYNANLKRQWLLMLNQRYDWFPKRIHIPNTYWWELFNLIFFYACTNDTLRLNNFIFLVWMRWLLFWFYVV